MEQLEAQIAYRYPYAAAARAASKLTATQLKGRTLDLEAAEAAEPALRTAAPSVRRPHFRADEALAGLVEGDAVLDGELVVWNAGHLDFAGAFAALREIDYDGWYTLECRLRGDPEVALPATAQFLRQFAR